MNARKRMWAEVRAVGWPVVLFNLNVALSLAVFVIGVLTTSEMADFGNWVAVGTVVGATIGGVLVGQLASLLRVRSTLFLFSMFGAFCLAIYAITFASQLEMLLGEALAVLALFVLLIGSIMASSGFWSLRVNRGLAANWGPLLLVTSTILAVSERQGDVAAWHAGSKYAVWSITTFGALFVSVALQIAFLAGRERHRLHRWRTAPVATEQVQEKPDPYRPFKGCGTWVVMGLLIALLTVGSALLAPYLWQTTTCEGEHCEETEVEQELGEGTEQPEEEQAGGGESGAEGMKKAIQQGAQFACALFTMVVLGLVGLFVFGLPVRRQVLITHLRNPMWPVTPTRRAHLHWRLTELALGDAGIHRSPSETALDLASRGLDELPNLNLDALKTAAEIADRVAYGYAMKPSDADLIGRAAEMTYQAVWEQLTEWERIKATYRML